VKHIHIDNNKLLHFFLMKVWRNFKD